MTFKLHTAETIVLKEVNYQGKEYEIFTYPDNELTVSGGVFVREKGETVYGPSIEIENEVLRIGFWDLCYQVGLVKD